MKKTKSLAIEIEAFFTLTKAILLIGIVTFAPLLGQQAITGPIVNATLFISTILIDIKYAIFVGLIPSGIALSVGLLPLTLAPMIPFIMVANAILIVAFEGLRRKNYWLAVFSASTIKFLFLKITSFKVIDLVLKKEVASKAALMMSWPQFVTAIAGGILAYLFLKGAKKI